MAGSEGGRDHRAAERARARESQLVVEALAREARMAAGRGAGRGVPVLAPGAQAAVPAEQQQAPQGEAGGVAAQGGQGGGGVEAAGQVAVAAPPPASLKLAAAVDKLLAEFVQAVEKLKYAGDVSK